MVNFSEQMNGCLKTQFKKIKYKKSFLFYLDVPFKWRWITYFDFFNDSRWPQEKSCWEYDVIY
jgi:hypothetical protein